MDLTYLLIFTTIALLLFYWYLTKNYDYWKTQNVPYLPDPIPIFGNIFSLLTKHGLTEYTNILYKSTRASMIGLYWFRKPALLVRHPDLVNTVLEGNFWNFRFNVTTVSPRQDPIVSKHPFFTGDFEVWKRRKPQIRDGVAGKKLLALYTLAYNNAAEMCDYLDRKINESGGLYECELKQLGSRYAGEFVVNSSFGVEGQSFRDNPDPNSFTMIAKDLFRLTYWNGFVQWVVFYLPEVSKRIRLNLMPSRTTSYFRENVKAAIKKRRNMKERPNDLLETAIEIHGEHDIENLTADLTNYYNDAYDPTGSAIAHFIYYMSLNPDIQDRLRNEVTSKLGGGPITYESLKKVPYLNQVIKEVLRIASPEGTLSKVCYEEVTLKGPDGLSCTVKPGSIVFIPMMNLHLDENYWPNPEVFDPDRFNPENEERHNKNAFFPFSLGPRKCAGVRLALVILRLVAAMTIMKFSFEFSNKTKTPLEVDADSMLTMYKGGVWAKFKKLETRN